MLRLIVEVDGPVHVKQREADKERQEMLEALDMTVLRFTADQVENDIRAVLLTIVNKALEIQSTSP